MSDFTLLRELNELLLLMVDDRIGSEQLERLNSIIVDHPQAARYYCLFMGLYLDLDHYGSVFVSKAGIEEPSVDSDDVAACRRVLETLEDRSSGVASADPEEVEQRRNTVKAMAEEALARFKKEERERQERLAYKQYMAMRRKLVVGVGAFAALVMILLGGWLIPLVTQRAYRTSETGLPTLIPPVAVVSESIQAQWADGSSRGIGTELIPGPLTLQAGFAEITFKNQAKLILEAPVEVTLIDEHQSGLNAGILTAYVPDTAKGFVVQTPSVQITDLGTAFGVEVDAAGVTDLLVADGYVATVLKNETIDESARAQTFRRDEAVRLDARSGVAQTIPVDKDRFSFSWEEVLYKPRLTGQITFHWETPESLAWDAFESDSTLFIFPERRNVLLAENLDVDAIPNDELYVMEFTKATLPAGSRVDCYLIHWDPHLKSEQGPPPLKARDKWQVTATVRFSRPIVGLIAVAAGLDATDNLFGVEETIYPSAVRDVNEMARGLEMDATTSTRDRLRFSEDRLELQMHIYGHAYDHLRILVASATEGM